MTLGSRWQSRPALARIATVLAPRSLGRLANEEIIRRPGHDQLIIRTFGSLPEALSWVGPDLPP